MEQLGYSGSDQQSTVQCVTLLLRPDDGHPYLGTVIMITPLLGLHSAGIHHHVEHLVLLDGYIREPDYDTVDLVSHLNFV